MGTNYYLEKNKCVCCGRFDEIHIGKSSAGWCFSLRIYPDDGIHSLEDWKALFNEHSIRDEYGRPITAASMLANIAERSHPRGLLRHEFEHLGHRIYGLRSRHGEGTYDLIEGEFS
jgi:hypothetical protein